ncbi:MAG: glycosyltransferase [Thiotrichaceae bacterium]
MIFVATGTQFPFDRLIQYMDEWASTHTHEEEVFAQLGDGEYKPRHIQSQRFLGLDEYNEKIQQASVFISHAGMGNIISAKEQGTPIIVINRQASLGEHRNDHQAEGLQWMGKLEGVYTASTQDALYQHIANRASLIVASGNSEESLLKLVNHIDSIISNWHK